MCHISAGYLGGIDHSTSSGTPVHVCAAGTVIGATGVSSPSTSSILTVDHGGNVQSAYMHMKVFDVAIGDHVSEGQQIGLSGGAAGDNGRGVATGPHIHWHIINNGTRVDPEAYVASVGGGSTPPPLNLGDEMAILRKKDTTGTYYLLAETYWYSVPSNSENTYKEHFSGGQEPEGISDARLAVLTDAIDGQRSALISAIASAVSAT